MYNKEKNKTTYDNEFEKQLEAAGYRWFTDTMHNSLRGFQKRFRDERGTKYFITGYHYNFGLQFPDRAPVKDTYSFDVQFTINRGGKEMTIDLRYGAEHLPNQYSEPVSLKEVEEFYEKAWKDMGAEYYELDNY